MAFACDVSDPESQHDLVAIRSVNERPADLVIGVDREKWTANRQI
jgi:hypothetical protein